MQSKKNVLKKAKVQKQAKLITFPARLHSLFVPNEHLFIARNAVLYRDQEGN
jgi:hypothetical protein